MAVSLAGHIILIILFTSFFSKTGQKREIYIPSYKVDLVTLPPKKSEKNTKLKLPAKPRESTKKSVAKSKSPSKSKKVSSAVSRKKSKETGFNAIDVNARIEELKKKYDADLAVEERIEDLKNKNAKGVGSNESSSSVPQKISVSNMDDAMKKYYDGLWEKIKDVWVLPGNSDFKGMSVSISVIISPSGELLDLDVDDGSGNGFYDQSAIRAINKSAPFPPLPEGYKRGLEIGFRFSQ